MRHSVSNFLLAALLLATACTDMPVEPSLPLPPPSGAIIGADGRLHLSGNAVLRVEDHPGFVESNRYVVYGSRFFGAVSRGGTAAPRLAAGCRFKDVRRITPGQRLVDHIVEQDTASCTIIVAVGPPPDSALSVRASRVLAQQSADPRISGASARDIVVSLNDYQGSVDGHQYVNFYDPVDIPLAKSEIDFTFSAAWNCVYAHGLQYNSWTATFPTDWLLQWESSLQQYSGSMCTPIRGVEHGFWNENFPCPLPGPGYTTIDIINAIKMYPNGSGDFIREYTVAGDCWWWIHVHGSTSLSGGLD
jgi:hypothetical protein